MKYVFKLKNMEEIAPKVKISTAILVEVLQSLVDEDMNNCDMIGTLLLLAFSKKNSSFNETNVGGSDFLVI